MDSRDNEGRSGHSIWDDFSHCPENVKNTLTGGHGVGVRAFSGFVCFSFLGLCVMSGVMKSTRLWFCCLHKSTREEEGV